MSRFLINKTVIYDEGNSKLKQIDSNKNEIKLDNLECIVFSKLLSNRKSLVSYKEFLQHWRSSGASENSLSRVVSLLRSKLKALGIVEKIIVNSPKKGYTFTGNVEKVTDKPDIKNLETLEKTAPLIIETSPKIEVINKEPTPQNTSKARGGLLFGLIIIMLNIVLLYMYYINSGNISFENLDKAKFVELLEDKSLKVEFNYNANNNNIVYSTKNVEDSYWYIKIIDRYYDNPTLLTEPNKNLRKPIWFSKDEIVYRVYDEKNCEIKRSTIDRVNHQHISKKLFTCNPGSYASAIAKLDKNKIVFSDAELGDITSNLYIGDLSTGRKKRIKLESNDGVGIYNIITSPNTSFVALLTSSDGISSKIHLVDSKREWKTIWSEELRTNNISIAWNGEKLTFKNNLGGLTIVKFDDIKELNRIHIPIPSNIYNISTANNGVLFTKGSFFSKDIAVVDTNSLNQTIITEDFNAESHLGKFYSKSNIIFISNKTGLNQIWIYNSNNGITKQLTRFRQNHVINSLSVSYKLKKIAIEIEGYIQLYSLNETSSTTKKLDEFEGIMPEFFEEKILYTKYNGVKNQIMSRDFKDNQFKEEPMNIHGGFQVKNDGINIYYSKLYMQGVWKYNANKEDKLIYDSIPSSYPWLVKNNKLVFQNDTKEYFTYDLSSKQLTSDKEALCPSPTDILQDICIRPIVDVPLTKLLIFEW